MAGEISADGEKFYAWDLDEITSDEAIEIEDATGLTWGEFTFGLSKGSAKALRAVLWFVQSREDPGLKPEDVSFHMTKFDTREGDVPAVPLSEASEGSSDSTESSLSSSTESNRGNGDD